MPHAPRHARRRARRPHPRSGGHRGPSCPRGSRKRPHRRESQPNVRLPRGRERTPAVPPIPAVLPSTSCVAPPCYYSLYDARSGGVLVKLAAAVADALDERARLGTGGTTAARRLAAGARWCVEDVVCTCTPDDRPFEEQHAGVAIAIVVAGTFQYRTPSGRALMTPGSLLLGN